jgi:hypothetical protein
LVTALIERLRALSSVSQTKAQQGGKQVMQTREVLLPQPNKTICCCAGSAECCCCKVTPPNLSRTPASFSNVTLQATSLQPPLESDIETRSPCDRTSFSHLIACHCSSLTSMLMIRVKCCSLDRYALSGARVRHARCAAAPAALLERPPANSNCLYGLSHTYSTLQGL